MGSAVVLATLSGVLMIAQLIVAKATRDTLFLSSFPATALPAAMIATAAATLPAVLGGSRLITRFGPSRFVQGFLVANALGFAVEWIGLPLAPRVVAAALYVHVGLFGGLSVSGFWSVVNERFDPHSVKKVVGRIGSGFAIGGLLGGLLAERMSDWFGIRSLLLTLVPTNLLIALAISALAGNVKPLVIEVAPLSGLKTITSSRYLLGLGLLVVMAAISSSALDYSLKARVASAFGHAERLAKFFAVYYMVTSVVTVVLQSTVSRFSLQKLGIGLTLAVLPAALLLGGTLSVVARSLWAIVLLAGLEAVISASFFRSAYEPLYTPLPPQTKRATKAIIDVAADKLGNAFGSGAIWLALAFMPKQAWPAALAITMAAAGVSLWLSMRLQRGYVAELAKSLRSGLVQVPEDEEVDATTRLTLSQTHGGISRELLLREIAARGPHVPEPGLVASVAELASGQPDRILVELGAHSLDRRLVSMIIPLLEHRDTRSAAMRALEGAATESVGQLSDALLNQELSVNVRYRIPSILARVVSPRAVRALTYGLSDADFELRERCARALLALRRKDSQLRPPQALVIAAVQRELGVSPYEWKSRGAAAPPADPTLSQIAALSSDRSLQHVFTILCLELDPDELELSLRALGTDDRKLRGTALEYLENVIPGEIKSALWPHLTDQRPTSRRMPRSNRELADELKRTFSG